MKDPFLKVHDLLRAGSFESALDQIYSRPGNSIREEFAGDENHAWYIVGDIFFKQSNYEMAVHAFKKSLETRRGDVEAYCALANSYSAMAMTQKSREVLLEGLRIEPDDPALNYNFGNACFDLGEYEQAIAHYEKVSAQCVEVYPLARKNIRKARRLIE